MHKALQAFEASFGRVIELHGLHRVLTAQVSKAMDLSDLLRAQIVLGVSALDYFVHELTRLGMLAAWEGKRVQTEAFKRFPLPIAAATGLTDPIASVRIFENEIRLRHSFLAFQQPEKIADAIRLISEVRLWEEVAKEMRSAPHTVKSELTFIIDRRNKIAHEADLDPSYPGQRWPIDSQLVSETLWKLDAIVRAIAKVVM